MSLARPQSCNLPDDDLIVNDSQLSSLLCDPFFRETLSLVEGIHLHSAVNAPMFRGIANPSLDTSLF